MSSSSSRYGILIVIKYMNTAFCTVKASSIIGRYQGISRTVPAALIIVLIACAPGSDVSGPPFSVDLLPPVLQSAEILDERHIRFLFDETVEIASAEIVVVPPIPVDTIIAEEKELTLGFGTDQDIGEAYTIRMSVADEAGNSLSFLYSFSGWNPRVPVLLVNELNPRGSGNTPDCIELFTIHGGNLGGLCLRIGTDNRYSEEIVFPAIEIPDGEFILVHAKAEGTIDEIDEYENLDESGGLLSTDTSRDFWIPGAPGLPGNNGAVTLYARKGGPVIDAVIWSDRADDVEDEKLGWTSEGYIFACDLASANAWIPGISEIPYPSESVDVSYSTATRSLCRAEVPEDSDTALDWHTVPTRGQTFGRANSDEIYVP